MEDMKLHVVMIPLLAFGHMIPFLELSKSLAKRGHRITFISTPRNIERLPSIPPNLSHLIALTPITPPPIAGLPDQAQATTDVSVDQYHLIWKLQDAMGGPIHTFLMGQAPRPDWIIHDACDSWLPRMAHSFGVPCAYFSVFSAAALAFMGPPSVLLDPPKMSLEQLMVPPPWVSTIPTKVTFRYHEALERFKKRNNSQGRPSQLSVHYRLGATLQGCTLVAVRTSTEFEPEWLHQLTQLYQKPVLPVGFLSPEPSTHEEEEEEESTIRDELHWLDTQKHTSTVYVALGSEWRPSRDLVTKLALGLELAQLPFLWAYRGDPGLLPTGFQERIKGYGMMLMGWAPQPTFLSHSSVGAFLTHAGWGSTIEGLAFGKPLVMLPCLGDQPLNARRMEEEKIGVEVRRDERDGSLSRDAVAKALRLVMVEKEGEFVREKAKEMQKVFGDNGVQYVDEFLQCLIKYRGDQRPKEE